MNSWASKFLDDGLDQEVESKHEPNSEKHPEVKTKLHLEKLCNILQ